MDRVAAAMQLQFQSRFQQSSGLKRTRAAASLCVSCLQSRVPILSFVSGRRVKFTSETVPDDVHCRSSCRTTARGRRGRGRARRRRGAGGLAGDHAARRRRARAAARSVSRAGAVADLHRPSADQYPDLVHVPQLRLFSDATEIFIFISGYTAAFVYGRAMLESGFVIATARIMRRVWQIYVAHVFLFMIFLAEISYVATRFDNPLYSEEMGIMDFLKQPDVTIIQALLLRFRPANMDVLPLYIVLMLFLPLILWLMKWRADVTLALSVAALCRHLAIRSVSVGLSERLLGLQSVRLAIAVRVRRLVRARRRQANVADPVVADHDVDLFRLSAVRVLRHIDLASAAAEIPDAEAASSSGCIRSPRPTWTC